MTTQISLNGLEPVRSLNNVIYRPRRWVMRILQETTAEGFVPSRNGVFEHNVVVFRRDHNWNLMATKLNIFPALYGRQPCPADEIWIRDSDIVVVPKSPILIADDFIELVFTRGIYGVFPAVFPIEFTEFSTL